MATNFRPDRKRKTPLFGTAKRVDCLERGEDKTDLDDSWVHGIDINSFECDSEQGIFPDNRNLDALLEKFSRMLQKERGISKLYDWQIDCQKFARSHEDKNFIFTIPTSGGKTLVAEALILEVLLSRDLDAILVLPCISLVQEKIEGLVTLASKEGFHLEEYAGNKGTFPSRKRHRRCLFVCTIEKADSLTSSLQKEKRLGEVGLVVVDELHMIEDKGKRGACLETCLTRIIFYKPGTRIVGMSATIANLDTIARFLNAKLYISDFRPVQLNEFLKLEQKIYKVIVKDGSQELQPQRILEDSISKGSIIPDPDNITGLVTEVIPEKSCLIFCSSRASCENVIKMLITRLPTGFTKIKHEEKKQLQESLSKDALGVCETLKRTIPFGLAYHHAGLTMEERKVIERGFRKGTLCLLTCTSTLAAGVNLPASRVIIRRAYTGRDFLTTTRYRQMVGRAGRAGFGEQGESILIGDYRDRYKPMNLMSAPVEPCISTLPSDFGKYLRHMLLAAIGLGVANTEEEVEELMNKTFLASCIEKRD